MSPFPIFFVAGFGRCGLTMVMTMLDRGGFPVSGPRPAYESGDMALGRVNLEWVRAQAGRAVKWVDPLNAQILRSDLESPAVILHLRRQAREMAASQVKMVSTFAGVPNDRRTRRAFERDLVVKEPALIDRLHQVGMVYTATFDWILAQPTAAAEKLAAIVKHEFGRSFDISAAARVPLHRSPRCAPDLSIELQMSAGVK